VFRYNSITLYTIPSVIVIKKEHPKLPITATMSVNQSLPSAIVPEVTQEHGAATRSSLASAAAAAKRKGTNESMSTDMENNDESNEEDEKLRDRQSQCRPRARLTYGSGRQTRYPERWDKSQWTRNSL
jgi:hypothetical protein